jgi:hypothetical protein
MSRRYKKLVHEGGYAAEVEVELITTDEGWSPYLSLEDAERLDSVRESLRRGDLRAASRDARVYHLTPVSA